MDRFQGKYRISSARAPWWNYGANASYFITICTQNKLNFFGNVSDGFLALSDIGNIAYNCWNEIPKHFPFVELGEFVIMPNHVHGIVIINKTVDGAALVGGAAQVETQNIASLRTPQTPQTQRIRQTTPQQPINKFGPQSQNLASIVRGYKAGVTKTARIINPDFCWQPRYHDHIIRDNNEYSRIAEYIVNNPVNWHKDKFYINI